MSVRCAVRKGIIAHEFVRDVTAHGHAMIPANINQPALESLIIGHSAAGQGVGEDAALWMGVDEKAVEFKRAGTQIYSKKCELAHKHNNGLAADPLPTRCHAAWI